MTQTDSKTTPFYKWLVEPRSLFAIVLVILLSFVLSQLHGMTLLGFDPWYSGAYFGAVWAFLIWIVIQQIPLDP